MSNVAQSKGVVTSSKEKEPQEPTKKSSCAVTSTTNKETKTHDKMKKSIEEKTKEVSISKQQKVDGKVKNDNGPKKKKRFGFFRRRNKK